MNSVPRFHNIPGAHELDNQEMRVAQKPGAFRTYQIISVGAVILGTWDLLFARIFWSSKGVHLVDVLQSIASGIYGKASHAGGAKTAMVGAACHFSIALCMVSAYSNKAHALQFFSSHRDRFAGDARIRNCQYSDIIPLSKNCNDFFNVK